MKLDRPHLIPFSALIALIGCILSGPVGYMVVQITKPQPAWSTVPVFISNYHPIQNLPYYFGMIFISGLLILSAAHFMNTYGENALIKLQVALAVSWTIIFASLIFFNYICQTTFVYHLAVSYKPENDAVISMLSMANPDSLSWSIEMWGYAILGIATWFLSSFYRGKSKVIYCLLVMNFIVSLAGVVIYVTNVSWLLSTFGLIAYAFWNMLMIVLLLLIYFHSNKNVKG
jgi:hypothetical protein